MSDTKNSESKHPLQTTIPEKIHDDEELAEAALEELRHYIWRADTSPEKSTLDPNLRRAEDHLEALRRSLHTGSDRSSNASFEESGSE